MKGHEKTTFSRQLQMWCLRKFSRFYKMESSSSSKTPSKGNTKMLLKLTQAPRKDRDIQPDDSTEVEFRKLEPEWLARFFKRTFFDPCSEHLNRRNELNKYCIDCDLSLCQFCLSPASHGDHRLLKIYRHVYKDVVPLDEMEQHIDCSQIQPYRCNKQLVIALTPLPHVGGNVSDEVTCQTCKRKLMEYDLYSYCSISCKVEAFTKKEDDDSPPFLSLSLMAQTKKQGSELKKVKINQSVQKAKQESELKKTTTDQSLQKANKESKVKETYLDQLVQMAKQESELKMTADNQLEQETKEEPQVKKRTHGRKGIPCRAPFY